MTIMNMLNKSLPLKNKAVSSIAVLEPFPYVSNVLMSFFLEVPEVTDIFDTQRFDTLQEILDEKKIHMVFMDLVDVNNDHTAGLSFIAKNALHWHHIDLVLFTSITNVYTIEFARKAGAIAIINKHDNLVKIKQKIETIFSRETFPYPREWGVLNSKFDTALTRRESAIIYFLSHGKSIKEISDILGISYKTAHSHKSNIMNKLGVRGLFDLHKVIRAIKTHPEK
ncbi:Transcriptional regulatory protein uhpA [Serratia entomophila]|uniref:helix-turn-helix transcriptional regulator n=1 Tax=Serratia entomophila TaxID=42906 RepID=UPI00217974A2|nr:LuxR C-terminal-related transcriptional regulator [Serratia entomophila]CAI1134338.1 Transcriptional regulatory protein uhpA [Serratia entomophila]